MNKPNFRLIGVASVGLCVSLAPLACGSDENDDDFGMAGNDAGGSAGNASGGKANGGKTGGGGNNASGETAGGASGEASGGAGGAAGEGGVAGEGGAGGTATVLPARLRVVHAAPSAPSVDIYAKGSTEPAAKAVAYGEATAFIELEPGTVAFDLRPAGASATSSPVFTSDDIDLDADAQYTLVAAGDFAEDADADVSFRLLPLQHDFEAPTGSTAVARIVHATTAWDDVDLDVVATSGVDVPALPRFGSESNVSLPAGSTIPVEFQTEADGVLTQLLLPRLTAGSELVVVATGNPGMPFRAPANGFTLLVVDEDGNVSWVKERPWLHVVHASDVGGLDLYETANTAAVAKLVDDLSAQSMAAFQLPESATGFTLKAVSANAAGGTATGLASGNTSTLESGEHYLSYIAGDTIRTIHEQFDLEQPTKAMLRGVHASVVITQTVDFGAVTAGALVNALVSSVLPGESSAEAGVAVSPGNVTLGAAAHSSTTPLAEKLLSAGNALAAGDRGFVLLTGADGLWLVDASRPTWTLR